MSEAGWVAFLWVWALFIAGLEIEVEAGHGWAEKLPTWYRRRGKVATVYGWFMAKRPLTGYHVFALPLPLIALHAPYFWGQEWTWAAELRTIAHLLRPRHRLGLPLVRLQPGLRGPALQGRETSGGCRGRGSCASRSTTTSGSESRASSPPRPGSRTAPPTRFYEHLGLILGCFVLTAHRDSVRSPLRAVVPSHAPPGHRRPADHADHSAAEMKLGTALLSPYHALWPTSQGFGTTVIGTPGPRQAARPHVRRRPEQALDAGAARASCDRHGVKATFFVVGKYVEQRPDLVGRVLDEGHALGNHTYSHANLSSLGREDRLRARSVRSGRRTPRAASSRRSRRASSAARRTDGGVRRRSGSFAGEGLCAGALVGDVLGLVKRVTTEKIMTHAVKGTHGGDVILLHDGDGDHGMDVDRHCSLEATELIIERYGSAGLRVRHDSRSSCGDPREPLPLHSGVRDADLRGRQGADPLPVHRVSRHVRADPAVYPAGARARLGQRQRGRCPRPPHHSRAGRHGGRRIAAFTPWGDDPLPRAFSRSSSGSARVSCSTSSRSSFI